MIPENYLRLGKTSFPKGREPGRARLSKAGGFKIAVVLFLLVMLTICLSGGEHAVPLGR